MLAFIDSPIQLLVVIVVLLIVFGPQKLPEMLHQLGRGIRELKRASSDLSSSLNLEDRYDSTYDPPRYDSYGNYANDGQTATIPDEDVRQLSPASTTQASAPADALPHGDFAASAMADTVEEYGFGSGEKSAAPEPESPVYGIMPEGDASKKVTVRPAEGSVSRNT